MNQELNIPEIKALEIDQLEAGKIHRFWFKMAMDALSMPIHIPLMIARGKHPGPVLGITAAVHGNELNGIPVIQRLFKELEVEQLYGTIVGVPVVNAPGLTLEQRAFNDGTDLNHIMPGKSAGNDSEVYAHRFFERIVRKLDFLIDLHTASFGRINSYYIRADLDNPVACELAWLQNAEIIAHKPPADGTLRGAADEAGIPAVTLEVGNPHTFQKGMIRSGLTGIYNVLCSLKMQEGEIEYSNMQPVICRQSYWIYTQTGGLLRVLPELTERVKKGQLIALQHNLFGDLVKEYYAPEDGIVIGKSTNPVNQTGGRILHLGIDMEKVDLSHAR
jgi:predicted deacylase